MRWCLTLYLTSKTITEPQGVMIQFTKSTTWLALCVTAIFTYIATVGEMKHTMKLKLWQAIDTTLCIMYRSHFIENGCVFSTRMVNTLHISDNLHTASLNTMITQVQTTNNYYGPAYLVYQQVAQNHFEHESCMCVMHVFSS